MSHCRICGMENSYYYKHFDIGDIDGGKGPVYKMFISMCYFSCVCLIKKSNIKHLKNFKSRSYV